MALSDDEYLRLRDKAEAALKDSSADALADTREAVRWCRVHLPPGDPELAWALVRLAYAACRTGHLVEMGGRSDREFVFCFEEALANLRAAFGPHSEAVAGALSNFVDCLRQWNPPAVVAPLQERLDVLQALRDPSHPDLAVAEYQLAEALYWSGQREAAGVHYRKSLDIWAHHPGDSRAALAWSGWGFQAETAGSGDGRPRPRAGRGDHPGATGGARLGARPAPARGRPDRRAAGEAVPCRAAL